jgi:hypothetical protein
VTVIPTSAYVQRAERSSYGESGKNSSAYGDLPAEHGENLTVNDQRLGVVIQQFLILSGGSSVQIGGFIFSDLFEQIS